MDRLKTMPDSDLRRLAARLKRDVRDFHERVRQEKMALESVACYRGSGPVYQRLSSILGFLREELDYAESELSRRSRPKQRTRSLSARLRSLLQARA